MDDDTKTIVRGGCLLVAFSTLCTLVLFGGCYGCSTIHYSDGYRDGTVQKVSEKGVVFKTVEGEMILGGMQFQADEGGGGTFNRQMFRFSVNDPGVRTDLEALNPGERIRLHYREMFTTWRPKGDTSYFITKVERIK